MKQITFLFAGLIALLALVVGSAPSSWAAQSSVSPLDKSEKDIPASQTAYERDGLRVSVRVLRHDSDGYVVVALDIDNLGTVGPTYVAALRHRTSMSRSQATISDDAGDGCDADIQPIGISQVGYPDGSRSIETKDLTVLQPQSRMTAVFRFSCKLNGKVFSLLSEFAVAQGDRSVILSVPFWGLVPQTK